MYDISHLDGNYGFKILGLTDYLHFLARVRAKSRLSRGLPSYLISAQGTSLS